MGDSLKDLQAATSFNMEPILVRTGNGDKQKFPSLKKSGIKLVFSTT